MMTSKMRISQQTSFRFTGNVNHIIIISLIRTNYRVNLLRTRMSLCCGKFPQYLLDVWDTYDKKHSSENDRPGELS